ncbi:ImpA family type VI secretion system protein [Paraburkholderia hayleyella]|uniref:type VI secretion system protein TssA n=1 Tax=Paraburkholderia hayleyella TaxID=2152889 RepID=UPI00129236E6|nr:type VI secretion system ImpA family N-terminal domain-containing protein [Paraburkholderia hayleyella]
MSKKHAATQSQPARVPVTGTPAQHHDWLAPVSDTAPCGPDLEYDHDFVVLFSRTAPRQDVQYGDFVGGPDPLNWSEIERDCRRLMMRTRDIRVAGLYTRCRTRLSGAAGLLEGIGLLAAWLQAFPDEVHPQASADNDRDATLEMRMNALQALSDPEGLLVDVREIVLMKSTATRLQVRDLERAFAHPHPADALAPDSVIQQLRDWRIQQHATMKAFDETLATLAAINEWCTGHLESHRPDFSSLTHLLQLLHKGEARVEVEAEAASDTRHVLAAEPHETVPQNMPLQDTSSPLLAKNEPHARTNPAAPIPRTGQGLEGRQAALELISMARQWFEANEPSSPIPVLLRRAERFVGKSYAEAVKAIPAELLLQWEEADRA